MSRICDICQKTYKRGNLVSTGIGQRVSRRTLTKQLPNLHTKRLEVNGTPLKLKLCTACLKKLKQEARAALEITATQA